MKITSHSGISTILAGAIVFLIMAFIGAQYFFMAIFSQNMYNSALTLTEQRINTVALTSVVVTPGDTGNYISVSATNTGHKAVTIIGVFVTSPSGVYAYGANLAANTSPGLPVTLEPGQTLSSSLVTTVLISSGVTYYVTITTSSGNSFSATYPIPVPPYVNQATSSGSLSFNAAKFKWFWVGQGQQSAGEVGGYPATAAPSSAANIVFSASITNTDPNKRSVTLWPGSEVEIATYTVVNNAKNIQLIPFFIIDGMTGGTNPTGISAYNSTENYITLPYGVPSTVYFGATAPLSSTMNSAQVLQAGIFQWRITLLGILSDGTIYSQYIPSDQGVATTTSQTFSASSGTPGTTITVTGSGWTVSHAGYIGVISSSGVVSKLVSFTTSSAGDISTSFIVPNDAVGYYTIVVSDYYNSMFYIFDIT